MKNVDYELAGIYVFIYIRACLLRIRRTARNLYTLPTCRANDLRAFTEQQDHIVVCSWLGRYGHYLGMNRTSQRSQTHFQVVLGR